MIVADRGYVIMAGLPKTHYINNFNISAILLRWIVSLPFVSYIKFDLVYIQTDLRVFPTTENGIVVK